MRESALAKMCGLTCGDVCSHTGIWKVQSPASSPSQTGIVNTPVGANAVVVTGCFWGYSNLDLEDTLGDSLGLRALRERTLDPFRRFLEILSYFERVPDESLVQFDERFGNQSVESSNTYGKVVF